ncbi:MAG: HEPN domain-containing protein [Candidatus Acidiferrales bacterium]
MNRADFQHLTDLRLKEAKLLLDAKCFEGAYYLAGYAIEFALKACIAKKTKEHDFPDKKLVAQIYRHDPVELLKATGLETELQRQAKSNKDFQRFWAVVVNWSPEARYDTVRTQLSATDLWAAITDGQDGILQWLKKRW